MKWVSWWSHRNQNDGRRASGVGYNQSRWHIQRPGFGVDHFNTFCGREAQHVQCQLETDNPHTYQGDLRGGLTPEHIRQWPICRTCFRIAQNTEGAAHAIRVHKLDVFGRLRRVELPTVGTEPARAESTGGESTQEETK